MVARSAATCQTRLWQLDLAAAFGDVDTLLHSLALCRQDIPDLDPAPAAFRVRVTRDFAALIKPGDPTDPLLLQVLPRQIEQVCTPGYVTDPVGDLAADRGDGLIQKYAGRALLITTGACAIHCRYCFRRHFDYRTLGAQTARLTAAIAQIADDPTLSEVILSGGDPLLHDDDQLDALIGQLERIEHLQRLRIHSRLPTVLPTRVTERLCARLADSRLTPVVVIHVNHANELSQAAAEALHRLKSAGVTLLNQSVLLRGVNDDASRLIALSERLFACGTLPYYLHQLDPVQGAAHFQVSDADARTLLAILRAQLPGYLVPSLVRDVPGSAAKYPIA